MDREQSMKLLQDYLDGKRLNSEELKSLEVFLVSNLNMVRKESK